MQYSQNQTQYGYSNTQQMDIPKPIMPQTGFNQAEPPPGVLIVPPPPIITQEHFKPYSTRCPKCSAQITTETSFNVGSLAKMWIVLMCCIFGWFGLFCFMVIPCCMKGFKDVEHTCPQCHGSVAKYKRHEITPQYQSPWFRSRGY